MRLLRLHPPAVVLLLQGEVGGVTGLVAGRGGRRGEEVREGVGKGGEKYGGRGERGEGRRQAGLRV